MNNRRRILRKKFRLGFQDYIFKSPWFIHSIIDFFYWKFLKNKIIWDKELILLKWKCQRISEEYNPFGKIRKKHNHKRRKSIFVMKRFPHSEYSGNEMCENVVVWLWFSISSIYLKRFKAIISIYWI